MNADDLRIFVAVVTAGAMNRAAGELNTVQSNVTARIQALEYELGTKLFDRSSKGVLLTPAGERLLPYARRILDLTAEAARAAADDGHPRGRLAIGSLETTAAMRLAGRLSGFMQAYPEVDLEIRTGTTSELIGDVLAGNVEGAFVSGPVDHSRLDAEKVFEEELVLLSAPAVGSVKEALAAPEVRIIVLRIGCSYRQVLEDLLARRGAVNVRTMQFGTLEAIVSSVSAGLGITLLPRALLGKIWNSGRVAVHSLENGAGRIDTLFVARRGSHMSSARKAFLAYMRGEQDARIAAE